MIICRNLNMTQIAQTVMEQTTCLNFNKQSQNTLSRFHKDTQRLIQ